MSQSDIEVHRNIAKKCFNEAWEYLDKKDRNADEERQMLHLAHASRFHWSLVGIPRSLAVSDWQIARIYVAPNQPHLALQFAKSSLGICEKNNLSDILHSAYEGIARAYVAAMDFQSAKTYISRAREHLGKMTGLDDEDKKIYLDQIRETEDLMKNTAR